MEGESRALDGLWASRVPGDGGAIELVVFPRRGV